jgi:hypothetical protein
MGPVAQGSRSRNAESPRTQEPKSKCPIAQEPKCPIISAQEPNSPRPGLCAQMPKSPRTQEPKSKCPIAQDPKCPKAQEPRCPNAQEPKYMPKSPIISAQEPNWAKCPRREKCPSSEELKSPIVPKLSWVVVNKIVHLFYLLRETFPVFRVSPVSWHRHRAHCPKLTESPTQQSPSSYPQPGMLR